MDSMKDFVIRHATVDDADAIMDILRALGHSARFDAMQPENAMGRVRNALQQYGLGGSHSAYVAHDADGTVLGYVTVQWLPYVFLPGPEGYVSELFVHPDASGSGIGTRLLEEVIAEAKERGCTRLSLLNMRDRESYKRGFYGKRGWQERADAANMVYPLPSVVGAPAS
jgi:GNAT superfamily N-acetyltransferase